MTGGDAGSSSLYTLYYYYYYYYGLFSCSAYSNGFPLKRGKHDLHIEEEEEGSMSDDGTHC